jgi:hypothetical protein
LCAFGTTCGDNAVHPFPEHVWAKATAGTAHRIGPKRCRNGINDRLRRIKRRVCPHRCEAGETFPPFADAIVGADMDHQRIGYIHEARRDVESEVPHPAPPTTIKFIQAFVEGIHYYKTHKPENMKTIAKYMRINDMESVVASYDYFAPKIMPRKPYPSLTGIKALIDLAALEKPEVKRLATERFVNTTILKEVDDSGFIDRLYR